MKNTICLHTFLIKRLVKVKKKQALGILFHSFDPFIYMFSDLMISNSTFLVRWRMRTSKDVPVKHSKANYSQVD